MGEDEHKDMIPYVIAGLVALVLIGIVWKWLRGEYVDALKQLMPFP